MKSSLKLLQNARWKYVLALAATAGLTAKRLSPTVIYPDSDGDWVNRQRKAIFYNRNYSSIPYEEVQKELVDLWCHAFNIPRGATVIDIGAGVGDDVVILSKMVGPAGRIIAIEAHPQTFRCLRKTVSANGLTNVTALNLAISDRPGELSIEDSSHHLANRVGETGNLSVRAITIDQLMQTKGLQEIDLIKLNIEGAETAALKGALKALGVVRHWVISCHDFMAHIPGYEGSATRSDVIKLLRQANLNVLPSRSDDRRPWVPDYVYASLKD